MGFRKKAYLWGILLGIFPPLLIILFIISVIKPAIKGKEPDGMKYVLWIFSLIFFSTIFYIPFGELESISKVLKDINSSHIILILDLIFMILTILLIYWTFRKSRNIHLYLPIKKFKIKWYVVLLTLISFLPLIVLATSESPESYKENIAHPLRLALITCLVNKSYIGLIIGFLGIGIFGPILEEFIFRGLLLEQSRDLKRNKFMRFLMDFFVCLFFALIHLPVSFIFPFILSWVMIIIRRKTGSLIPTIIMHCIWNICIWIQTIVMSV